MNLDLIEKGTISKSEFVNIDNTFNESMFLTKVNNMFVKYFTSIMMDALPEIKHFVSDEVYAKGEEILRKVKEKDCSQMYDELNVKESNIQTIQVNDDSYEIKVLLHSRYMDYIIKLYDGSYVSGNNTSRIEVKYLLTLKKDIEAKMQNMVRKCRNCGASFNVNASGRCEYCGSIYNLDDYDWIITDIQKLN